MRLTGSPVLACAVLAAWIFFPLWEMVFVLRQLRVPRHRELADARAPRDEFEELGDITHALVDAGFEQLDECRLRPAEHEQYYRIFVRQDGLTQATIGYIAQGPIGFHFIAFTSNGKDGRRWVTWDYPLTYGLVMPPNTAVYRALHCQDVPELSRPISIFSKPTISPRTTSRRPANAPAKPPAPGWRRRSTSRSNTTFPAATSRPRQGPTRKTSATRGAARSTSPARSCATCYFNSEANGFF